MRLLILTGLAALALGACDEIGEKIHQRHDAAEATESAPESAPESANAARLEADVRFLADDLLEGREAGSRGYDIAANFVAERYRALGLEPAGDDGSYFQTVPMRASRRDENFDNRLTFSGPNAPQDLKPWVDYFAGGASKETEGSVEAPLVFIGYGLVAEDYKRDDFAGLDVEGKIVVVMWGAPRFLNTEERAHYRSTTAKRASEHGAVGTIFLYTPMLSTLAPYERIAEMQKSDTDMVWLEADGTPHTEAPNLKSFSLLSPALSERLFENQPVSWEDIIAADASDDGVIEGFDMGMTARIEYKSERWDLESDNVIGLLPGSDPALADEVVALTAHLDHEGVKPTEEEGDDEIYNGAMDNAVGTATMLEVARLLAKNPPRRSVMFIALTAEEKGLVGSAYNARNPTVEASRIVANINLDMPIVTYPFTDIIAFGAERSTLYPVVEAAAKRSGLALSPDPQPDQGLFVRSDQYSYVKEGVPAIFLKPGFANGGEEAQNAFRKEHYHKASDEADLIEFDQMARFADVNTEIARGVAEMDVRPLWKKGDFFARTFDGPMEKLGD